MEEHREACIDVFKGLSLQQVSESNNPCGVSDGAVQKTQELRGVAEIPRMLSGGVLQHGTVSRTLLGASLSLFSYSKTGFCIRAWGVIRIFHRSRERGDVESLSQPSLSGHLLLIQQPSGW